MRLTPIPDPTTVSRGMASDADALVERVRKLRLVLPALAEEAAIAKREALRLRLENKHLRGRVAELEQAALANPAQPPSTSGPPRARQCA
jgi:regulator of replication initiation timing